MPTVTVCSPTGLPTTVPVTDEQAEDVSKLIDRLEQDEDVNKVFHNMG